MNSLYPERKKEKNRNHEKKTSARKYRVFPLAKIDIISDTSNHFHRSFPINPLHREPIAIVHLQLFPIYNPARVHATTPHPSTDVVFFIFFLLHQAPENQNSARFHRVFTSKVGSGRRRRCCCCCCFPRPAFEIARARKQASLFRPRDRLIGFSTAVLRVRIREGISL